MLHRHFFITVSLPPFRAAVVTWGQITWNFSDLPPKRDWTVDLQLSVENKPLVSDAFPLPPGVSKARLGFYRTEGPASTRFQRSPLLVDFFLERNHS